MKFYTNIEIVGSKICIRGYDNNQPFSDRIKFAPTLYIPTSEKTPYKSLEGKYLRPIEKDSISAMKSFIKEMGENVSIYGNDNFQVQFVEEYYPEREFDSSLIRTMVLDIEVESKDGFPSPEKAASPITAITAKILGENIYYVWAYGDYDAENNLLKDKTKLVHYERCHNEKELLQKFILFWSSNFPDVVTGWNVEYFDIPYIIKRICLVIDDFDANYYKGERNGLPNDSTVRQLSYWNTCPRYRTRNNEDNFYIHGTTVLDYLDLYKKFCFTNRDSYKLDNIAHIELKEKKLDYSKHGSLHEFYINDFQGYINYNVRDVELIELLDERLGYLNLAYTITYLSGSPTYISSLGTVAMWDTYIYNVLKQSNIIVPPKKTFNHNYAIEGGYVKEPHVGMHEWVCSFDLNSLYPHLIMQYNMSPETVVPRSIPNVNVENMLKRERYDIPDGMCMAATGQLFKTDSVGFFPKIIDGLYAGRTNTKNEMIEKKREKEKIPKSNKKAHYEIDKLIARLDGEQHAIKIMMNSLYGALSNKWFRYYNTSVAEAITISGQLTVQWAEQCVNDWLNKGLKTDKDYVIAIDTDSLYITLAGVKGLHSADIDTLRGNSLPLIRDRIVPEILKQIHIAYDELQAYTHCPTQRMEMKLEIIANKAIWTAKKKYVANVFHQEGVDYEEPKLKIVGLESVKSSTPEVSRNLIKHTIKLLINTDEETVENFINEARTNFYKLSPYEIALTSSINNLNEFGEGSSKKMTPMHVRGALTYNQLLIDKSLTTKHEAIFNNDKVKIIHLREPNPIAQNVISFKDSLPIEFDLDDFIDYDEQFNKTYYKPMKRIFDAIGWYQEKVATLEEFF